MRRATARSLVLLLVAVLGLAVPASAVTQEATSGASPAAGALPDGVDVVASWLTNPRGFAWGPDGELYLALAGTGGDSAGTLDDGTPTGLFGGPTASVVRVEEGCPVPVAEGLPSTLWRDVGWIWGVMDVAFLDDQLYALSSGGGIEGGLPDVPNGVYRVADDGSTELVADLSAWFRDNPPSFIPPDFGNDGSLFDLEAGEDRLWVSEAVGGRLLTVTPDGQIELIADLSEGHMVPDGVELAPDGGAYVGHETVVPYPEGLAKVIHVAPDGTVTDHWTGLTAMTDLVMGPEGTLYAAEMATNNLEEPPYLRPGSGRIVRQTGPDGFEPVVTDIEYPVYLGFGPDDALYLTYPAFAPDAGEQQGALLRIDLSVGTPISLAGLGELAPTCQGGPGAMRAAATPAP